MRFIGSLFLRRLVNARVIEHIFQVLLCCPKGRQAGSAPEEHAVECLCALVTSVGSALEGSPAGRAPLDFACGRLQGLRRREREDGGRVYSKRIQYTIQDVLDARAGGWTTKAFKTTAKPRGEIRAQQEQELEAAVSCASPVPAGRRPAYLSQAS